MNFAVKPLSATFPSHHYGQPILSFAKRLALHLALAIGLLIASLLAGILGYRCYEHLSALDAFINAAMLLGGMGPVNIPVTSGGKLFAGFYALYAGLVFIVTAALIITLPSCTVSCTSSMRTKNI